MAPSHPRWPPELVPEVAYHEGGPGPGESMVWGALWDAKILMIVGGVEGGCFGQVVISKRYISKYKIC